MQKLLPRASKSRLLEHLARYLCAKVASKGFPEVSFRAFSSIPVCKSGFQGLPEVLFLSIWLDTSRQKWLPRASQKRRLEHLARYLSTKVAAKGFPEASFRAFGSIPVDKRASQGPLGQDPGGRHGEFTPRLRVLNNIEYQGFHWRLIV